MNELETTFTKFRKIKRFIISGGIGTLTHFGILIFLTEYIGFTVMFSTTVAFIFASVVSFTLQKLWTFESYSLHTVPSQMILYLGVTAMNITFNALSMYILHERLGWYYLLAQFLTSGMIAVESYTLYRYFVFHPKK